MFSFRFLAVAAALVVSTPAVAQAKNCFEQLEPTYDCTLRSDQGQERVEVLTPLPGGASDFQIRFVESGLYQCACQSTGTAKKPKFHNSSWFICGTSSAINSDYYDAIVGKVQKGKIKRGQMIYDDGDPESWSFECEAD